MADSGQAAPRILAVDDDPFVLESITWVLKPAGYEVIGASSGREALALLEKEKFDLVLTDYSMPRMRGDELLGIIKQRQPNVPVIIMTAYLEMLECAVPRVTGVEAILGKPFLAGGLCETIARFLPKKPVEGRAQTPK